MLSTSQWHLLDAAVVGGSFRRPSDAFIEPYRSAAYAGQVPWTSAAAGLSPRTRMILLEDMARHASSAAELGATVRALDDAQASRADAWITAGAGSALIDRAKHGLLPEGWRETLEPSAHIPNRISGGYWARATLRAAGVPTPERQEAALAPAPDLN